MAKDPASVSSKNVLAFSGKFVKVLTGNWIESISFWEATVLEIHVAGMEGVGLYPARGVLPSMGYIGTCRGYVGIVSRCDP